MQEVWIEFLRKAIPAMITIMIILGIGFGGVLIVLFYQWIAKKLDLVDKSEPRPNPNLKACLDHNKDFWNKAFDCEEKKLTSLKVINYRVVKRGSFRDYIITCKDNLDETNEYVKREGEIAWFICPDYNKVPYSVGKTLDHILSLIIKKEKKSK